MSGAFPARRPGQCGYRYCVKPVRKFVVDDSIAYDKSVLMHEDCARAAVAERKGAVSMEAFREAKAALELVQDLQSIAATYGHELQLSFTLEGVSAVLCRGGFRALTVEPCRDVQTAGNRVMCWLEAQR